MGSLFFVCGSAAGAALAWLFGRRDRRRSTVAALNGVSCGLLGMVMSISGGTPAPVTEAALGLVGAAAPLTLCMTLVSPVATSAGVFSAVRRLTATLALALVFGIGCATMGFVLVPGVWHISRKDEGRAADSSIVLSPKNSGEPVTTFPLLPMKPRFLRRPSDWAGVPILALILAVAWASHYSQPPTPLQTVFTPYLPINLVEKPSPRKVFAHYMPTLPISIDNKDGAEDYYATEYLTVNGEDGKHAAYGGFLRDRPLPRPHSDRADWKSADLLTEISQAKSVGIDGFAVDVFTTRAESDVTDQILRAAAAVDGFTIMVTADVTGPLS